MILLAFFGGRHPKQFFHRNTTTFRFRFGDNAVSQPIPIAGVLFCNLAAESFLFGFLLFFDVADGLHTMNNPKNANGGPKIASFRSRVSICGSMGSHPEGPSRSDGISLMLSRLRRFDSRHSRF
jgi:hypothetical protein